MTAPHFRDIKKLGFTGLGVMGGPMCRNLAAKSGLPVFAFDPRSEAVTAVGHKAVVGCATVEDVAEEADLIFLSLPGGNELLAVAETLLGSVKPGAIVLDHSTAPVALTRELAGRFSAAGAHFADAPVARTRAAAEAGTLSVMVGAKPELYSVIMPYLEHVASDVTRCGGVGAGQAVKLLNNMVLFETVAALSEALAIGRAAGLDPELLFRTLSKGSADSFALRNHGLKAMLPGEFPDRAFSVRYARKDLAYALELARDGGIETPGAAAVRDLLERAEAAGDGERYFPVVSRLFGTEDGAD